MTHPFDIRKYGACSDGKTMNTVAFQGAIDACHQAGGGQVVCGHCQGVQLTDVELSNRADGES